MLRNFYWLESPNIQSQADRSLKILNLELNVEVNTNQNSAVNNSQSHTNFYEDLLTKIEETKLQGEANESKDSEDGSKLKLLENLQEILLKYNRKSDFIFMLLLQSMITKVVLLPVSINNFRYSELVIYGELALRRIVVGWWKNKMRNQK